MLNRNLLRYLALVAMFVLLAAACGEQEPDVADAADTDETEVADETEAVESAGAGDGTLQLGYVLPETGQLAFLGPPQIEATNFAIQRINEAGGVLGEDVPDVIGSDGAGDPAVANQAVDRLLSEDVDAIIGAAASGISLAIIDKITGAEVVQCSGSNTGPAFTDYDDGGYYFRTAPSDVLQGPVLANLIIEDGYSNVAILFRQDEYGQGLADAAAAALEEAGATVAVQEGYDPNTTNFDSVVQAVESSGADSVIVIAFEEGAQLLQGLIEADLGPDTIGVYGTDGLRSDELPSLVAPNDPGVLAGMKGTAPNPGDEDFLAQLQEFAPDLESTTFAGQVYDCVTLIALAAEQADSDDPSVFKDEIVGLTQEGEACTSFEECKTIIDDGGDVDYNGASGELDFIEAGEPGTGTYEVYGFNEQGELESLDIASASLPE